MKSSRGAPATSGESFPWASSSTAGFRPRRSRLAFGTGGSTRFTARSLRWGTRRFSRKAHGWRQPRRSAWTLPLATSPPHRTGSSSSGMVATRKSRFLEGAYVDVRGSVHYSSVLGARDVMRHEGIPVTTPARTLVDLAGVVNDNLLRTAVRRALAKRRVGIRQLVATRRRLGRRRGSATLNRVLRAAAPTRSELEDVVFDLIVDAGFVRPDVNQPLLLAGRRIVADFRWAEQQIVVEADSRAWHDNPLARADDAERQTLLEAHGDGVVRVTWEQAVMRARETVARIEAAGVPRPGIPLGALREGGGR
ncbi:MAG: DUF559 domain-containing protein [Actinobacteria bacterium]|nr:MAG: DUF559 domain-containing protein [Actinomycetota bacterium]